MVEIKKITLVPLCFSLTETDSQQTKREAIQSRIV